jgi:hypothetical protein
MSARSIYIFAVPISIHSHSIWFVVRPLDVNLILLIQLLFLSFPLPVIMSALSIFTFPVIYVIYVSRLFGHLQNMAVTIATEFTAHTSTWLGSYSKAQPPKLWKTLEILSRLSNFVVCFRSNMPAVRLSPSSVCCYYSHQCPRNVHVELVIRFADSQIMYYIMLYYITLYFMCIRPKLLKPF